jgi:hypothetical protein
MTNPLAQLAGLIDDSQAPIQSNLPPEQVDPIQVTSDSTVQSVPVNVPVQNPNDTNIQQEIPNQPPQVEVPIENIAQGQVGSTASDLLSKIAAEDFTEVKKVVKFVKEGFKLDNAAMQTLLFSLKNKYNMSYRDLLAVYLTLDIAVEKGALTNEVLDYLRDHPEEINKLGNTDNNNDAGQPADTNTTTT